MSNYYLCDTCAVFHEHCDKCHRFRCIKDDRITWMKVIYHDQAPHEVCTYWIPKEEA